ncbi:metal ABC transporter substrate-binding protein [Sulfurimonas autotrophica]|uniref:Periplasmic solute binding protein n=1 Tax=Sulfurimonas autotrophica (strain ATCC BAA-671 / DSM 16294 / JCM 11897 / OK10) TaxID=563040 RepID=E0UST6_SULAO|nr:metal ABC transporter substrate-binding protein [Sulfurimonas autotrophica]ADN08113.1 periplasmic solute binding protein [Sulfurimonas autotrophica DSM 16294]
MRRIILLTVLLTNLAFASVKVDTTYSTAGAVAQKIGGDLVHVTVLGSPKYDPHFIVPKPSLISKLRRADLLIINGGGLELGWLPPLLRAANNAKIQNGAKGFLDMSHFVHMIDVPASISRAFGDVHAQGNPHYTTDPYVIVPMAKAIAQKLSQIDPQHQKSYEANLKKFTNEWQTYLNKLDAKMLTCKDKKVVQYHELFNYFLKRYNYKIYGTIEPLPGIAPSSKHTIELINIMRENGVKKILQDVYHERKTAQFIAAKTGAKVLIIPHDLGADGSKTLQEFYNKIANRICQ